MELRHRERRLTIGTGVGRRSRNAASISTLGAMGHTRCRAYSNPVLPTAAAQRKPEEDRHVEMDDRIDASHPAVQPCCAISWWDGRRDRRLDRERAIARGMVCEKRARPHLKTRYVPDGLRGTCTLRQASCDRGSCARSRSRRGFASTRITGSAKAAICRVTGIRLLYYRGRLCGHKQPCRKRERVG